MGFALGEGFLGVSIHVSLFRFHLDAIDPATGARVGRWETPHGTVETPAFMPVGTLAEELLRYVTFGPVSFGNAE